MYRIEPLWNGKKGYNIPFSLAQMCHNLILYGPCHLLLFFWSYLKVIKIHEN
jgi:hypothetical protein